MKDKKYYAWVVPTILVVGLLVGLVFSFQPAQAVSNAPASIDTRSPEVGDAPTATGPVCTTDMTGAISYWDLDETSGTTFDDSITTNDGTCDGDTCPSPVAGTTAGGQFFIDTDGDFIVVESPAGFDWTAASDFSVGAWVKTTQDCTGNTVFTGRYHKDNGSWWIGCVPEPGDTGVGFAAFHMRDSDSVTRRAVGTTEINDGRWHYIVGVRNATTDQNRIYVDGVSQDTVSTPGFTGTFSSGTAVTIGAYDLPFKGYYFNGTLDEVAIFSTALIDTDMATCTFEPKVGDVAFEIDTGVITELPITTGELLANTTGGGTLSILSVSPFSEKGGSIVGEPPEGPPYTSYIYTPPALYEGTDFFTFVVSDETNTAPGNAVINVLAPQFPVVTQPDDQEDNEGDTITPLQIVATDPNGDDMTYAATDLPTGLSIDPDAGIISGTVAYTAAQGLPTKIYSVTVTVTDVPDGNETPVVFSWTINRVNVPPVLENPGQQINHEGDVVSLQIVATDANEDTLTYGASGLPPGLSINISTGLISGTISGAIVSTYSASVTVTDSEAPPEQEDFDWVITDENRPPEITQPADQENTEGDTITPLQIVANDPDGDTLAYSALGLPAGLTIDADGLIIGTIAIGTSSLSPYSVTVTVEDPDGLQDSASFSWTVNSQMKKLYLPLVTK